MIPQVYRFVSDHGEQVHTHTESESIADPRIRWGWCNLGELWLLVKKCGFEVMMTEPHQLLRGAHIYKENENDKKRRHLYVALMLASKTQFTKVTEKEYRILSLLPESRIFVPAGWAQVTVLELAKRKDGSTPGTLRHTQALDVLSEIIRPSR